MSIFPHPETDLKESIIILGSEIIKNLYNKKDGIFIDVLLNEFINNSPNRTQDLFLDVITFLYAVDLIELENFKIRLKENGNTQRDIF